jgi:hypothetical protein
VAKLGAPKKPVKDVKVVLPLRVRPAVKAALRKAAAEDGRAVSQMAERLLEAVLRERGYLK